MKQSPSEWLLFEILQSHGIVMVMTDNWQVNGCSSNPRLRPCGAALELLA